MAANAKGKRRCKGKTIDLNTFLGEDQDAAPGFAVVQTRRIDWGDAMENEDLDDRFTLDYKKEEKVVLPTAPKAARGPDVDLSKVPTCPPFTAFLGNLPYDVSEDDIELFFRQLKVKNVRLPRENGDKGRIRGFGYAEFNNRQDLIQALALNNESLKNRAIKVSLAGEHDGERDRRDGGVDRTLGDWRSDKRDQFSRDEPSRNDSYSSRSGFSDREPYRARSNYDNKDFGYSKDRGGFDRFERNGSDRDFSFSRNDRDYGRDQDRFEKRSNDRGYGFSDRGMSRGGGGGGGGRRDFRDSFNRRDEPRDTRYRDSDRDYPPRDNDRRPPDRSDSERRKLNLAPRTKPIEPVPPPSEAVSSSSIFGGAKPVDTAAREREIEERLAKEKESVTKDPRERGDERVRKFSTGSGMSNRSRCSSDSGPPGSYKDEEEQPIPPYKPPIPRQAEFVKSKVIYPEHWKLSKIQEGLKTGTVCQGKFQGSRENYLEGFVFLGGEEDSDSKSIFIQGRKNLNRAIHGDNVAVKILPEEEWTCPSSLVLEDRIKSDADAEENEESLLKKKRASLKVLSGAVIGIIKKNRRPYCGILQPPTIKGAGTHYLFVPSERRIPKIRIKAREGESLLSKRIIVSIDSWPKGSKYPLGHYVQTLGQVGDKNTENQVLLLEHDIPHQPFSKAVLDCLPTLPWIISDAPKIFSMVWIGLERYGLLFCYMKANETGTYCLKLIPNTCDNPCQH